jgi:hypothetical protein
VLHEQVVVEGQHQVVVVEGDQQVVDGRRLVKRVDQLEEVWDHQDKDHQVEDR